MIQQAIDYQNSRLQQLSLRFDRLARNLPHQEQRGRELIPLFLDTVLRDSCSPEIVSALFRAIDAKETYP